MQKKLTLSEAQIADLREAFEVFDEDGNGTICHKELQTLMERVLGNDAPSKDQIEVIIKSVDIDESGTIDFGEFLALMSDPRYNCAKDEKRQVFDMFDEDGNGYICAAELKSAFRALGQRLDDDEFDSILREADLNGDKHIDYEEFLQMLKH